MATRRMPLPFGKPDDSGNCYIAPYKTLNSGTTRNPNVMIFKASVVGTFEISFTLPDDYVGSPQLEIVWTSETTTNTVDWAADHRTTEGTDTDLLDIDTSPNNIVDTDINNTGPSAASERMTTIMTLTSTDFVAGDSVSLKFSRDGVTDDKADNVSGWELNLLYSDA